MEAAAAGVRVEGTVQRITFRADDTGYTVLRLRLAPGSISGSSDGSASEADESLAAATASAAAAAPAGSGKRGRLAKPKLKDKPTIVVVGTLPKVR